MAEGLGSELNNGATHILFKPLDLIAKFSNSQKTQGNCGSLGTGEGTACKLWTRPKSAFEQIYDRANLSEIIPYAPVAQVDRATVS